MRRPDAKKYTLSGIAAAVERLREKTVVAARRARRLNRPVLAWAAARISGTDPVDTFGRLAAASVNRVLWSRPDEQCGVLGIGSAWSVTAEGAERFSQTDAAWQELLDEAVGDDGPDDWWAGPVAVAGYSFQAEAPSDPRWSGFPAGLIVLPRLCLISTGDVSWLTLAVVLDPDSTDLRGAEGEIMDSLRLVTAVPRERVDESEGGFEEADLRIEEFPTAADWKAAVGAAARAVRAGELEKVVLARGLHMRAPGADPGRTVQRLRNGYPHCTLFAFARGERCFLGATPERLVRLRDREVNIMALAGSAPRGSTPEEDLRFGKGLQASAKDRIEHAVVVDALRAALAEVAPTAFASPAPELLKLQNVQHLCTRLSAKLPDRRTVLDLVARLHPTPAVGGAPRDSALRWIRLREGMDRGWYAGPVGWVDRRGEGEFAVAIRSALLHDGEALLFAGCGIVADSDPDQEYAESALKLRPMLSALRGPLRPARARLGQAPR